MAVNVRKAARISTTISEISTEQSRVLSRISNGLNSVKTRSSSSGNWVKRDTRSGRISSQSHSVKATPFIGVRKDK